MAAEAWNNCTQHTGTGSAGCDGSSGSRSVGRGCCAATCCRVQILQAAFDDATCLLKLWCDITGLMFLRTPVATPSFPSTDPHHACGQPCSESCSQSCGETCSKSCGRPVASPVARPAASPVARSCGKTCSESSYRKQQQTGPMQLPPPLQQTHDMSNIVRCPCMRDRGNQSHCLEVNLASSSRACQ